MEVFATLLLVDGRVGPRRESRHREPGWRGLVRYKALGIGGILSWIIRIHLLIRDIRCIFVSDKSL